MINRTKPAVDPELAQIRADLLASNVQPHHMFAYSVEVPITVDMACHGCQPAHQLVESVLSLFGADHVLVDIGTDTDLVPVLRVGVWVSESMLRSLWERYCAPKAVAPEPMAASETSVAVA